jgi:hypothetical protein
MTRVLFFSAATSTTVCSSRSCKGGRVGGHDAGGLGEFLGCLVFAVSGEDPGAWLPTFEMPSAHFSL